MQKTIFAKIADREVPADIVFEDDSCVAFRDLNPKAPVHILVIPRKPIAMIEAMTDEDERLVGHLLHVATKVARAQGLEDGYRLVINNGESAGQSVFHLHVHLLGGRGFGWPPG